MTLHLRSGNSGPAFIGTADDDVVLWDEATQSWTVGQLPAAAAGYVPGFAPSWGASPPTTVANALDKLALPTNLNTQAAGALGPAATITFTSAPFTPTRAGNYLVVATIAGSCSGAATEACELLADAVSLATASVGTANANEFQCTLVGLASISTGAPHTLTVRATASAGNNSAASGGIKVIYLEVGG